METRQNEEAEKAISRNRKQKKKTFMPMYKLHRLQQRQSSRHHLQNKLPVLHPGNRGHPPKG